MLGTEFGAAVIHHPSSLQLPVEADPGIGEQRAQPSKAFSPGTEQPV